MKKILLPLLFWGAGTITLLAQPVITTQPTNQVVLNGSNAIFNITATGSGLLTYQWQCNGTNLPRYAISKVAGTVNGSYSGDGGPATSAGLAPIGVTVDSLGDIFISDYGNARVRKVDTNGIISTLAIVQYPDQLAVDNAGNLYIADSSDFQILLQNNSGVVSLFAGNHMAAFAGDGGPATNASICIPGGMTLDQSGNLYFADSCNHRIRKVDANGIITTMAGNGSAAYTGDGGLAKNASLNSPHGLTIDGAGDLFIADTGNNRIRKVDLNGIITTVAGNGQATPAGDGGSATNASFGIEQVAVDTLGNIFFTDYNSGQIREVDTSSSITTPVTGLFNPDGLFVDGSNNLFVADSGHFLIGKIALYGSPTLSFNPVTTNNAGNYDVIISDARGSVTSSIVSLTVNVPVFISTQPQSHSVSVASNATFNVSAGGTLPLTYQWLTNGIVITGATNASYTFNVTGTNLAGGYSIIITNNYGSVTSSVAMLTVLVLPPGIAEQPATQTVKGGSNATLSVIASGSPPFIYQWFFNGAVLDGQTNSALALLNVTTNQAGAYSVSVASPYGSITSQVAILMVGWLPGITMQPTNQSVLAGNRVLLTASVSGVGPLSFQWQLNGTNLPNNLITTIAGDGTAGFTGDSGIATTGKIYQPYGVAADGFGNVFIADTSNNRIRKVSTNGVMTTVAGTGVATFYGDGGAATNARIYSPEGVSLDASGNLYLADAGNNRIRKVDTNGIITTVAGKSSAGFSGDGGAATNATLYNPYGIMVDTNGNLFIADTFNNRIRKVDTNGVITTIAGKSISTSSGDGGAATNAGLSAYGVTVDGGGNLLIADRINNRVRRVDAYGFITTIAGTGTPTFSGDGGVATNAGMTAYGVAVDNYGDVYIADRSNNRIRRVDPYGIITTVAGTNGFGYSSDGIPATGSLLYAPSGIALDNYGRFLIADTGNNRIRRFGQGPTLVLDAANITNAGNYTLVVNSSFGSVTSAVATLTVLLPPIIVTPLANQTAGLGSNATFTITASGTVPLLYQWQMNGTNLPNQTSQSLNLTNVQWSDAGNYAVILTNNYGCITSSVATLIVGNPPAVASQSASQMGLAGTNLLISVSASGDGPFTYQWQFNGTNLPPIITTVAGTNGQGYTSDGILAAASRLNMPQGVAMDMVGNLYIADYSNNRVRKVDTNGIITTIAGTGTQGNSGNGGPATSATLYRPAAVTFDTVGNLYISEYGNGDVRKVDTNGIITRVVGTGSVNIASDGAQATATAFDTVAALAFDSSGSMYLCESYHCRIRKVGTNGIVTTVAGNTAGVTGGFSGDGGLATNAQLNFPSVVVVDAAGNLLIADSQNYRVRRVDGQGIITTIAGNGSTSYSGDNNAATNVGMIPFGLAVDGSGNLFISNRGRGVNKVDTNGIITTVAGRGTGFSGDGGPATNAFFNQNWGIGFDRVGNLFVADWGNGRVRKIHLAGDSTFVLPNLGTTNTGTYTVIITSPFGSVTSSNIALTVLNVPVVLGSPFVGGDLSVTLNLSTTPNISSRVYAATNLTPPVVWLSIYTNLIGGIWQFTDTNVGDESVKFYRVSTP